MESQAKQGVPRMMLTHGVANISNIMEMVVPEESMEEAGATFDKVKPT